MHDMKDMRTNPQKYQTAMINRGDNPDAINCLIVLDEILRAYKTIQQERQVREKKLTSDYAKLKGHPNHAEIIQSMQHVIDLDTLIAMNEIKIAVMDGNLPDRIKTIVDDFRKVKWSEN